jgi:outer membrane protein TolC
MGEEAKQKLAMVVGQFGVEAAMCRHVAIPQTRDRRYNSNLSRHLRINQLTPQNWNGDSSMRAWIIFLIFLCAPSRLFSQYQGASAAPAEARGVASLRALVQEAMERNPEILAARRAVEAKRARVPQAGAWPDPKLSVSYAGNVFPPFTVMVGDPSSTRQIMAEQEIPYPGKTRLRTDIASREADAETLAYEGVWRRIAAEVKQAYFDLWFTEQSLSTLRKDRELLAKFEKIAEVRYSAGKATQQDVLKAQVELTRLLERQTVLEQARQTFQAQLNGLRNFPVDAPLGTPEELKINNVAPWLDELQTAALANYPALRQQRTMVAENRLAVDLAKREVRPDFSVGYTYMQRARLPDMYGITFSTSLPIFRHRKQDKAIAEAAANLESSRQREANELTMLRYRVKQEFLDVLASEQLLTLYSQGIVPQSSLALESSISSYETGAVDFLNVLGNFTTLLDYELNYKQQIANHEKALARLEELTALNLIQ